MAVYDLTVFGRLVAACADETALRSLLSLGTAATRNATSSASDTTSERLWRTNDLVKQTSNVDTTSGRVMLNGAHGLGAAAAPFFPDNDFNNLTDRIGFARNNNSIPALNSPPQIANTTPISTINVKFGGTYGWQLAGQSSGSSPTDGAVRMFFRNLVNGSWSNWGEVWNSLSAPKQASQFDTTAGSLLLNGAHGLGSILPTEPLMANFATITPSGFYRGLGAGSSTPTLNAPPGSGNSQLGILCVRILSTACYYYVFENSGTAATRRFWVGQNNSGTVSWQQIYHDGSLPTYTNLTLLAPYTWDSAGDAASYNQPSYAKFGDQVRLRGKVTLSGTHTDGNSWTLRNIAVLPVGFRPLKRKAFIIFWDTATPLSFTYCLMFVNTDGGIYMLGAPGQTYPFTEGHFPLDQIWFDLAP